MGLVSVGFLCVGLCGRGIGLDWMGLDRVELLGSDWMGMSVINLNLIVLNNTGWNWIGLLGLGLDWMGLI